MRHYFSLSLLLLSTIVLSQSFTTETVIESVKIPWGIDWLPGGEMLITDRGGDFFKWDGSLHKIENVPEVIAYGQGGLLDVKVHPKYEENGFIYLSFSKPAGRNKSGKLLATTAIIRAKLVQSELVDIAEIFQAEPASTTRHHYGSRIVFDDEGYMFFSVGDRGNRDENPQALNNHCGKIHRINDDGSIPEDNPFVNNPIAMPSIYSYGHRNPQGLVWNSLTSSLMEHEHGPKGGDELNIIKAELNYGWPVISYGINYNGTKFTDITEKEGMEQPETYWVPSIAPSGLEIISSDRYPTMKGNLLIGSLSFKYLHLCKMQGEEVLSHEKHLEGIGRVRTIRQGPDGYIYLGVENEGVLRLLLD